MPVRLDADQTRPELAELAACSSNAPFRETGASHIRIGLINNMPDGALQATERQFVKLIDLASNGIVVDLSLYSLPDIPRTAWGRCHVNHFYSSVERLWNRHLDALIVTGTEPLAAYLREEPYWADLTKVFEWAAHNTYSTIWSCLAAHAALLHTDGIPRRRLSSKRFGVFNCEPVSDHELTAGAPSVLSVPHSRWNDIPEEDLADCGYRVLTRSRAGGVDSFVKQRKSLFVFLQGHPEYETNTLLLEYRRDVGRYLRRERDTYPEMPRDYFDQEAMGTLTALRDQALSNRREELLVEFPTALAEKSIKNSWHSAGLRLYTNWLAYLCERRQQRSRHTQRSRQFPQAQPNGRRVPAVAKRTLAIRPPAKP